MSKYRTYRREKTVRREPHPIWRGIGCLLLIIMPLLAWGISELVFPIIRQRWALPYEWTLPPQWPDWMWKIEFLVPYLSYTQRWSYFLVRLILWSGTLLLLWGGMSLVYAFLYARLAPPDPLRDLVPPPKVKRYRR